MMQSQRRALRNGWVTIIALVSWLSFADSASATCPLVSDPADIIIIVDGSGSMTAEVDALNTEIDHLSSTLVAANIDYRIILIAEFGTGSTEACIEAPTGGIPAGGCSGGATTPINVPRFRHYSTNVASSNSLCKIIETHSGLVVDDFGFFPLGWQFLLRPEALKVLILLGDDQVNCSSFNDSNSIAGGQSAALAFDIAFLSLNPAQFGTLASRNYVAHSIIAMEPNAPPTEPWLPTDPISIAECFPGSNAPGTGQQALSVLTGGLRFPSCDVTLYDDFFTRIAQDTIARVAGGMPNLCNGSGGTELAGCTDCPCINNNVTGTIGGCINSSGNGTRLIAEGDPSISLPPNSNRDLRFSATGVPPNMLCVLNSGDDAAPNNPANPCFGLDSGIAGAAFDGLRCAVVNTQRHGGRPSNASGSVGTTTNAWGGEANPTQGIGAFAGFVAGQTRYFQIIHRDSASVFCMTGLNTSQAIKVVFEP